MFLNLILQYCPEFLVVYIGEVLHNILSVTCLQACISLSRENMNLKLRRKDWPKVTVIKIAQSEYRQK